MASYLVNPVQFLYDANGKPVSGGKIYIYDAGTTNLTNIFSDVALSSAAANPIIASSAGRYITPYLADGNYKIVVTDSSDVTLSYPAVDNFPTFITSSSGAVAIASGGTGATSAATALTSLGAASAADVSTLSSAVTTVTDQIDAIGGTIGEVAALSAVTPTDTSGMAELCIQSEFLQSSTVTSVSNFVGTGTTPTNANGTELLSQAFTPSRSDSTLVFDANINIYTTEGDSVLAVLYLCRSDSTNAIQIAFATTGGFSQNGATVSIKHRLEQGTTTAVTWSIRAANESSGDSFTMNTSNWGGISKSSLSIKEVITTPV